MLEYCTGFTYFCSKTDGALDALVQVDDGRREGAGVALLDGCEGTVWDAIEAPRTFVLIYLYSDPSIIHS